MRFYLCYLLWHCFCLLLCGRCIIFISVGMRALHDVVTSETKIRRLVLALCEFFCGKKTEIFKSSQLYLPLESIASLLRLLSLFPFVALLVASF